MPQGYIPGQAVWKNALPMPRALQRGPCFDLHFCFFLNSLCCFHVLSVLHSLHFQHFQCCLLSFYLFNLHALLFSLLSVFSILFASLHYFHFFISIPSSFYLLCSLYFLISFVLCFHFPPYSSFLFKTFCVFSGVSTFSILPNFFFSLTAYN